MTATALKLCLQTFFRHSVITLAHTPISVQIKKASSIQIGWSNIKKQRSKGAVFFIIAGSRIMVSPKRTPLPRQGGSKII
jgi:hypothetical protein